MGRRKEKNSDPKPRGDCGTKIELSVFSKSHLSVVNSIEQYRFRV